jgi:hypothetical protein
VTKKKVPAQAQKKKSTRKPVVPISSRTDWDNMEQEFFQLSDRLRCRPNGYRKLPNNIFGVAIDYATGNISDKDLPRLLGAFFKPTPIDQREDWETMRAERVFLYERLMKNPNRKNTPVSKPEEVVTRLVVGDIDTQEALAFFRNWAGLPIEKQQNIYRLRRQVLAIIARLQQLSSNHYANTTNLYLFPDQVIEDYSKGSLSREQAITCLNGLIERGHIQ